jgi:hypothetical protein
VASHSEKLASDYNYSSILNSFIFHIKIAFFFGQFSFFYILSTLNFNYLIFLLMSIQEQNLAKAYAFFSPLLTDNLAAAKLSAQSIPSEEICKKIFNETKYPVDYEKKIALAAPFLEVFFGNPLMEIKMLSIEAFKGSDISDYLPPETLCYEIEARSISGEIIDIPPGTWVFDEGNFYYFGRINGLAYDSLEKHQIAVAKSLQTQEQSRLELEALAYFSPYFNNIAAAVAFAIKSAPPLEICLQLFQEEIARDFHKKLQILLPLLDLAVQEGIEIPTLDSSDAAIRISFSNIEEDTPITKKNTFYRVEVPLLFIVKRDWLYFKGNWYYLSSKVDRLIDTPFDVFEERIKEDAANLRENIAENAKEAAEIAAKNTAPSIPLELLPSADPEAFFSQFCNYPISSVIDFILQAIMPDAIIQQTFIEALAEEIKEEDQKSSCMNDLVPSLAGDNQGATLLEAVSINREMPQDVLEALLPNLEYKAYFVTFSTEDHFEEKTLWFYIDGKWYCFQPLS